MTCQIYINGREWLARQLDRARRRLCPLRQLAAGHRRPRHGRRAVRRFAHKAWPRVLNAFARRLNPILPAIRAADYGGYYWVLDQAEIATDVMFKTRPQLLGGVARPGPPRRVEHVLRRRAGLPGPQAAPVAASPGGDRRQTSTGGMAGPSPDGRELGEGLRQGLRPAGGDHDQQSARVPDPTRRHRPTRAGASGGGARCERA